jgi:osmotically inducible lipoprotein OsmB
VRTLVARRSVVMGFLALLLAGCTAANQGAATGGIIGATGGALIGAAAGGNDARNMGVGALIGGLAGEVIQNRQAAAVPVPPVPGPPPGRRTRPWA